jgi:hypothetical protein
VWRCGIVLVLISVAGVACAEDVCPWLTQGTAAALMGEEVRATVQVSGGEGTCGFYPGTARGASLRITVSHLTPKACAAGERVTGVGQDAVFCSTAADGGLRETIRGRVRNTYFLLELAGGKPSLTRKEVLRRSLEQAAEEVAGNLF